MLFLYKYVRLKSGDKNKMDNIEYIEIVEKIFENRKFNKLKEETHHHNSNRYNHCVEVSYKTYKICKKLNLDYKSATKAALLHDFFFNHEFENKKDSLLNHPKKAKENAMKITKLSEKEINIIESHMYPIGKKIPRHIESIIVDLVDDYVAAKEKLGGDFKCLKQAINFLFIFLINIVLK